MSSRSLFVVLMLTACTRGTPSSPGHAQLPVFTGMCDASGAVPLSERVFIVADDEDNVLRAYDADRAGAPLFSVDLSESLGLPSRPARKTGEPRAAPETDIEAATRIGDLALWITSHGRTSSGKLEPARFRFFATSTSESGRIAVVGRPYETLIADLVRDARYAPFALDEAAQRTPKEPGGLNIEGMTARAEGGVFIGLRNPVPAGKALVVTLLNPDDVILHGAPARFGDPLSLDLGGLGVRGLSAWRGRYLLIAGDHAGDQGERASAVYVWNGRTQVSLVAARELAGLNPEGFFSPEARDAVLLLSDDGTQAIDGTACKRHPSRERKQFRGLWLPGAKLGD